MRCLRSACFLWLSVAGLLTSSDLRAEDQRALIDLTVDHVARGTVLVYLGDGDVFVRSADLYEAGLRGLAGRPREIEGQSFVSLASLKPNLTYTFDEVALELRITVPPSFLVPSVVDLATERPAGMTYGHESAAFLNYTLQGYESGVSGVGEAGVQQGDVTFLGTFSRGIDGAFLRGETSVTLNDRPRLRRWVLGDNTTTGGMLGGSVSLAGVTVTRAFNLDPYFSPHPAFGLSAVAFEPSVLETYVNERLVHRQEVPPGPVELRNLPVTSGHGSLRVVVRDRSGKEQELVSFYYALPRLLAHGLSEYTYSLGIRRDHIGSESWRYLNPAFVGRHRVGFSDAVTVGADLEAAPDAINCGPSLTARLPVGELDVAAAASRSQGVDGAAASAAFGYRGRSLGVGGAVQWQSKDWFASGLTPGAESAALRTNASAALQIASRAGLSVRYTRTDFRQTGRTQELALVSNITLARQLHLHVTAALAETRRTAPQLWVQLSYSPWSHTTATLSRAQSKGSGVTSASIQRSLPVGTGYGYQIEGTQGSSDAMLTRLQFQGPHGRYEASLNGSAGKWRRMVSASGALVLVERRIHLTRPANQGFALLRVPGIAGVRTYLSGQEVGRTNRRGELVVPNVIPYYGNRLSIEEKDVPPTCSVDVTERIVAPPSRGAVLALFPVQRLQSISGKLLVEVEGKRIIPAFGQLVIWVDGHRLESPLGKLGEFCFERVSAGVYTAEVECQEGVFRIEVTVPPFRDSSQELGTITCVAR